MINHPMTGEASLRVPIPAAEYKRFTIKPVRNLNDFQMAATIRAATFMSEQNCPFEEEFDGNDFCGTQLIAFDRREPVATLRIRWFAGFGKVERVCVLKAWRGSAVVKVMLAHAFELAARKGYTLLIAQIQARLWPVWSRMLNCSLRGQRESFSFSDYEYVEIEIPLAQHADPIGSLTDAYVIIRPEGDWDKAGVLEKSAARKSPRREAA